MEAHRKLTLGGIHMIEYSNQAEIRRDDPRTPLLYAHTQSSAGKGTQFHLRSKPCSACKRRNSIASKGELKSRNE